LNVAPWYIKVSIGMQSMSQSYARPIPEALCSLISREVARVVVESALLRFHLTRPNS